MATKGASNRYPTNKRSPSGKSISHINYEWARDFNKKTIDQHFNDHGKSMGFDSKESYKQHAIKFANTIDRKNCTSFVAENDSTYKYNKVTNEFAIITKDGYIVTYYKPTGEYSYYKNQEIKYSKGGKGKNEKI